MCRGGQPGKPKLGEHPSATARTGRCGLFCGEERQIMPKQKGCEECVRDLEAMRRDARQAGPKARQRLKKKVEAQPAELMELWKMWTSQVGSREKGRSRVGFFSWARYEESYANKTGTFDANEKLMKTRKELALYQRGRNYYKKIPKTFVGST